MSVADTNKLIAGNCFTNHILNSSTFWKVSAIVQRGHILITSPLLSEYEEVNKKEEEEKKAKAGKAGSSK